MGAYILLGELAKTPNSSIMANFHQRELLDVTGHHPTVKRVYIDINVGAKAIFLEITHTQNVLNAENLSIWPPFLNKPSLY